MRTPWTLGPRLPTATNFKSQTQLWTTLARSLTVPLTQPQGNDSFAAMEFSTDATHPPRGGSRAVVSTDAMPTYTAATSTLHNIPLAGHLGRKKTTDRIMQRFYWPGMFRDVEDQCRICPECQKSSTRRPAKAPLLLLPIMEEPFQRIAMDIVGPLPQNNTEKDTSWSYATMPLCI